MFPHTASRSRRAVRGFTLLEILIALAILGLLVGLAVGNLDKIFGNSQESVAKIFVNETIKIPLNTYKINMGTFPSTSDGLQALVTPPSSGGDSWRGPYLANGKLPSDPWNQPYQYACPGSHNKDSYDCWSKGDPAHPAEIGNW